MFNYFVLITASGHLLKELISLYHKVSKSWSTPMSILPYSSRNSEPYGASLDQVRQLTGNNLHYGKCVKII